MLEKIDLEHPENTLYKLEEGCRVCLETGIGGQEVTGYVTKVISPSLVKISEKPWDRMVGFLSLLQRSPGRVYDIRKFKYLEVIPI